MADTNCWVSYFIGKRFAATFSEIINDKRIEIVYSEALLSELRHLALKPTIARMFPDGIIEQMVEKVCQKAILIPFAPALVEPVCRDPNDDFILALAAVSRANAIVTGDKDLLGLRCFKGCPIFTATEFLLLLKTNMV